MLRLHDGLHTDACTCTPRFNSQLELAGCPFDFQPTVILILSFLTEQADTFHTYMVLRVGLAYMYFHCNRFEADVFYGLDSLP